MSTIDQISSFGLHCYQNSSIAQKVCFVPALEMGAKAALEGIKILFKTETELNKHDRDQRIIKFGCLATGSLVMGLSALNPVSSIAASILFVAVSTIISKGNKETNKALPKPITMKLAGVIGSCTVSLVKKIQSAGLRVIKALQNGISSAGKFALKGLRFVLIPFKLILKQPKLLLGITAAILTTTLLLKISNMALSILSTNPRVGLVNVKSIGFDSGFNIIKKISSTTFGILSEIGGGCRRAIFK